MSLTRKVSEITKSVYYYWINCFEKTNKNNDVVEAVNEICKECDYTYGYCRVTQALKNKGMIVNHKKVGKIIKELGLTCTKFNHKNRN
ncbi:IS3 family transposase [Staphylococcus haemolyticus]|uniref:IS3 family transposase n=1 Tax=Staphylococcus haemolyticus TaxID=1283 RepID=UPI003C6EC49B